MQPGESQPGSLAERLRRLREDAGLTGDQLGADLGWREGTAQGKVSKIERGVQLPSEADIEGWARVTGHLELTDELLDLRAETQTIHKRWRKGLRTGGAAAVQQDRDARTRAATRIRNADPILIPGLLQTVPYARSVIMQATLLYEEVDIDGMLAARMQRQQVLWDTNKTFEFIISESALHLMTCPPDVMLIQLNWLLALAMPNVKLGIIPFGTVQLLPYNTFTLLDDDLTIETLTGASDERGGETAALYHRIFDLLMAEALTGDDARQLIMDAAGRLREG